MHMFRNENNKMLTSQHGSSTDFMFNLVFKLLFYCAIDCFFVL
jgi:hypothetical protein